MKPVTGEALVRAAGYCAPHVLAALVDVPRVEAVRALSSLMRGLHQGHGAVDSRLWWRYLESLGGVKTRTRRPHAEVMDRMAEADRRYARRWNEWKAGRRDARPRPPSPVNHAYPTVAEFLRNHPEGTYVLQVDGHTLLAREGRVDVDTRRTRSRRARVHLAHKFPRRT